MIEKILLVCCIACSITSAAPPALTKCKFENSKCMTSSAQEFLSTFTSGNPEWGVETLDPLSLKSLDASSSNLKLTLQDITAKGLEKCIIKKIQFDPATSKLLVKAECTVDIEGQYEIDGQIQVLPIQGNGRIHVVLRKVLISADADIEEVTGKDGLQHWSLKRYSHSYELNDKATIELDNLFNGNEVLSRAINELFASSPNEVITEVGTPIISTVVDKIVKDVHHFFKKVPLNDLVEN